jgi:hypothetical protein
VTRTGRGEWTVDGSAADLRRLSAQLRTTGQSGLKKNMRRAVTKATTPCRAAVRDLLREEMPKRGGLNNWMASAYIAGVVLTGPKTAGVVLRGRKQGHDLVRVNETGIVRHPTYGHRGEGQWQNTEVPDHFWERALEPFGGAVREALKEAQNVTAREAGFI